MRCYWERKSMKNQQDPGCASSPEQNWNFCVLKAFVRRIIQAQKDQKVAQSTLFSPKSTVDVFGYITEHFGKLFYQIIWLQWGSLVLGISHPLGIIVSLWPNHEAPKLETTEGQHSIHYWSRACKKKFAKVLGWGQHSALVSILASGPSCPLVFFRKNVI